MNVDARRSTNSLQRRAGTFVAPWEGREDGILAVDLGFVAVIRTDVEPVEGAVLFEGYELIQNDAFESIVGRQSLAAITTRRQGTAALQMR
jgi:hypothetical protein